MSDYIDKNTDVGWKVRFADNGWLDWICPACGKTVHNDNVHVDIDWVYCPYCGALVESRNFKKRS